ncbi:White collar 1 protein [Penicillium macrosclerotiorum]|uniref:White collar 1 protein n=1 Tax=Penicillium macrosclerotiorum TaxID=303699 RepID=UPI00254786AB|nr:White collar 1 protein [Penicillium macrosclerotiorum]KAJ5692114.1 White collar 1 protein [Penicillium macrosclerotiorum]
MTSGVCTFENEEENGIETKFLLSRCFLPAGQRLATTYSLTRHDLSSLHIWPQSVTANWSPGRPTLRDSKPLVSIYPGLWNSSKLCILDPTQAEACVFLFPRDMANPMNSFNHDHSAARRDDPQDPREGVPPHLQQSLPSHDPSLMGFPPGPLGNYGFGAMLPQDDDLALNAFDQPQGPQRPQGPQGPQGGLESRLSNVMLTYDTMLPGGVSMGMSFDPGNAFAYDVPTTYPATSMGLAPATDHSQLNPSFSPFPQSMPPAGQYFQQPNTQPQPRRDIYPGNNTTTTSTGSFEDSDFSRASERSQQIRAPRPVQERPRPPQPVPYRPPQHVAIQPKKPVLAAKGDLPSGMSSPDAPATQHTGIYSSSGFDVLGVLSRVAMRPNPKINIGAVDLSCAFVLCDITRKDHPIVYVSEAFERLTGYTKEEIIDRNCRFLQSPDGHINAGAKRTFVDGGQPFMNLITMIPIRWDSDDIRFYVGFQVDLVEKPDAVTKRNPDGTYTINYQRDQLPQYVVQPPELYRLRPDLTVQFGHDEVTAILNAAGVPGNNLYRHYLDRILVENSDDVIHVLSFNGEFLYLSPSCRRILEYEPIELVGRTLSTICHPSDIGPVIRDLRGSTTPAPISVVYRIRQKYKGYTWFESHGSWHIDPTQGRKYLVMTGRTRPVYSLDQIARLGSNAALAENDIWVKTSLSGVILFATSKSKPVLGRSPDDLIGKSLHDLMEPESDPNAIIDALDEAANDSLIEGDGGMNSTSSRELPSFRHKMRHKKGHSLSAHTTLYPGDAGPGLRPSFLVAQIRFARAFPPSSAAVSAAEEEELSNVPGTSKNTTITTEDPNPPNQYGALGQRMPDLSALIGLNGLPAGNRSLSPSDMPATFFTELNPTRGSSWQIELRELEKQNRTLADELQRLLGRRKKRKRKQIAAAVEKSCSMCSTKSTPEWRRGPSGNRDLCNSCGLRWAKQVRSQARAAAASSEENTNTIPAPAPV